MNMQFCNKQYINHIFLIVILGIAPVSVNSQTYYVDSVRGNDHNSGAEESNAWKSIHKINRTVFDAGDIILFKQDHVWRGDTLSIKSSGTAENPITISAYGEGRHAPKITVATLIPDDSWVASSNGEYYYHNRSLDGYIVLLDSQRRMSGNANDNNLPGPTQGHLEPGEWVWNQRAKKLFYKPLGSDPPTNIEVVSGKGAHSLDVSRIDNLIVRKLDIYGGYEQIVRVWRSDNIQIEDCDIHSGFRGLEVHHSNNISISNNRVYDINYKGIGIMNGTTNSKVMNNHVFDIGRLDVDDGDLEGILVGGGHKQERPSHIIIESNLIENIGHDWYKGKDGTHSQGTMFSVGIEIDAVSDITVAKNTIRKTWRTGIHIIAASAATKRITVHSNILYDIGHMTTLNWVAGGIYLASSEGFPISDVTIFNNTLANNRFALAEEGAFNLFVKDRDSNIDPTGSKISNIKFYNNIIHNIDGYLVKASIHHKEDGLININLNNNIYWKSADDAIHWKGTTYTVDKVIGPGHGFFSFDTHQDAHSIFDNPAFDDIATNDFYLSLTSPAIDAGRNSDRDSDFDGNPIIRIPDIGALENQHHDFDADDDGLSNNEEIALGTDPNNPDTDNDSISDGDEVNVYHTDPKDSDTDNDDFPDGTEIHHHSDPSNPDSTPCQT